MDNGTFEHEMSRAKTFQVKSFLKNLSVGIGLVVLFTHMSSAQWVQTNGPGGGDVLALAMSGSNIFAALAPGGVYRSTNNGASWTAVDSGLPTNTYYVTSFAVSGGNIFAGTQYGGVFLSTNNGTSWTAVNSGLTILNVYCLAVSDSNIFAGTVIMRGGIWRRPLSEMLGVINPISQRERLNQVNFDINPPGRTNHSATIEFSLPHSDQVTVKVYNLSGKEMATLVNKNLESGAHSITWNIRNIAAGCYTVRMHAGSKTFAKSIAIFQ